MEHGPARATISFIYLVQSKIQLRIGFAVANWRVVCLLAAPAPQHCGCLSCCLTVPVLHRDKGGAKNVYSTGC
jgi:hypothetical protein